MLEFGNVTLNVGSEFLYFIETRTCDSSCAVCFAVEVPYICIYPSVVTKGKTKVILWSKHHIMTVCGRVSKSFMHTFSLDVGK
jgi:hypothetical protein